MRVYVSSSVADDDQNILSALSISVQSDGVSLVSGYLNRMAFLEIKRSQFFIGLITSQSMIHTVQEEWQQALQANIPALLLIDETIPLNKYPAIRKHSDIITFNRSSQEKMQQTIQAVRNQIDKPGSNTSLVRKAAWFVGGPIAVKCLNIIAKFSLSSENSI